MVSVGVAIVPLPRSTAGPWGGGRGAVAIRQVKPAAPPQKRGQGGRANVSSPWHTTATHKNTNQKVRCVLATPVANQHAPSLLLIYGYIAIPSVRDVASTARWRSERLSHWDVITNMLRRGLLPSPLMSAPWVKASIFRRDWLHCSDQGVAADFGGNLSSLLATKMPGANIRVRTQELWERFRGATMLQVWTPRIS